MDTGTAEADDVGQAVAIHVSEMARVLIVAYPAATGLALTESSKLEHGSCKISAAVRQGHDKAGAAKPDNVGHPVAVHVSEMARVLIVAEPATSRLALTESSKLEHGSCKIPA